MAAPRPGLPVRGSRSGRPIMALLDLLGRRWALRLVFELREDAQSFRALQERIGEVSPSVLNTRLAELRGFGLVEAGEPGGYRLTAGGRELLGHLLPLHRFAERLAARAASAKVAPPSQKSRR